MVASWSWSPSLSPSTITNGRVGVGGVWGRGCESIKKGGAKHGFSSRSIILKTFTYACSYVALKTWLAWCAALQHRVTIDCLMMDEVLRSWGRRMIWNGVGYSKRRKKKALLPSTDSADPEGSGFSTGGETKRATTPDILHFSACLSIPDLSIRGIFPSSIGNCTITAISTKT